MSAQFIQGSKGYCYLSVYMPQSPPSHWVLCFPPFAEEMNKSRKMMAAQARSFATAGFAVVIPDLYGTGDSAGDFADADWKVWRDDMLLLIQWIRGLGGDNIHFWGIRLGALLALDVNKHTDLMVSSILLWQPVCDGRLATTQFLRLRMAAGLLDGSQVGVSQLRDQLQKGSALEIAGYEVTPGLIDNIEKLTALDLPPSRDTAVNWLEIYTNAERPISAQSRNTIKIWHETGVNVHQEVVAGDSFWATQEITWSPVLLRRSTELLTTEANLGVSLRVNESPQLLCATQMPEVPMTFECEGSELPGILHQGAPKKERGVMVLVGGPQYRVGSHRQFVLLARALAGKGIPVFRFDYRGMGDAEGSQRDFETITDDIRSAVDCFVEHCPGLQEVVIWGLCDAATAASYYAYQDERIRGLILLNPWVRSEVGEAKAYIRHYYLKRIVSRELWKKIFSGQFTYSSSLRSFRQLLHKSIGRRSSMADVGDNSRQSTGIHLETCLATKVERSLQRFHGNVLLVLSENDLTAAEFKEAIRDSPGLRKIVRQKSYTVKHIPNADHTFSRRIWRDTVAEQTLDWLYSW